MARVMHALEGQPVLFRALAGFPGWQAVAGVCARREHFAAALGCRCPIWFTVWPMRWQTRASPPVLDSGPCQEIARSMC